MLKEEIKKRIRIYSPSERARVKARCRRADAVEVARGNASDVQEKNRALPHASEVDLPELERELPSE